MGKVFIMIMMEINLMVYGKMEKKTEKVLCIIKVEENMKGIGKMMKLTGNVICFNAFSSFILN